MSGGATNPTHRSLLRTFIAIDLPTSVLSALATVQEQARAYLRAEGKERVLRWSPIKNLHLTLRYLGDTTPSQREQVTARWQQLAAEATPFTLSVDTSGQGLGGFPNLRQPRVLWIGVGGDLAALGRLQSEVEAMTQAVGFAAEEKDYAPHLTLARIAHEATRQETAQVGEAISQYAASLAGESLSFTVDRMVYYQSELSAGGSRYTPLAHFPFSGA